MAALGTVLAHQGGWDEILFVLAPLVVFAGLLSLARKRADQLDRDGSAEPVDGADPAADAPGGRDGSPTA